ncbi:alpha/beta fold hydrolase [Vibrio porteresiae]|uniref:Alpha/beta hydrolase n=1 Tax=Vibrio porteresiae DSM 19223 TaxID=1123496 RepID=A0ABZ0QHA5_9VIBR|nr:alpha/beta hydrolase [Vibrio porteresiae]WPC75396.1 alpha/beta hydrolase [Vibrio porteresiae DSM 19223]
MKEFKLNGCNTRLRYHDLPGNDTPILFIHGLGCASSFDYPQVVSTGGLESHRRILVDMVGSGFSDKPEDFDYSIANHANCLAQLINHLGLSKVIIYGHSMGGAVSISLAKQISDRVQTLILSEANLDAGGGFFSQRIASFSESDFLHSAYTKIIQKSIESGNTEWAAGLSNSLPLAIYKNALSLIAGEQPSWRETFYALPVSKTYIFGSNSLPDPDAEILANHKIQIEIVPGAGHSMAWENPEGLARAIKKSIV